jgi:hypothetical protein
MARGRNLGQANSRPNPNRHATRHAGHLQREREPDDAREDEAREEGEADLLDYLGGEVRADRVEAVRALALEERALEHNGRDVRGGAKRGERRPHEEHGRDVVDVSARQRSRSGRRA